VTNLEQEKHSVAGKRMSLLFMVIFFALAVLIFRLSFIQLSEGEDLLKKAENNRYITQSVPAPRGIIYDREDKELVRNKAAFTITFQRLSNDVQDPIMLIGQLSKIWNKTPEELYKAMDPDAIKYPPSMARKVITQATDQQVAYVREHADELPGFNVVVEPVREYVMPGNFGSHVLGYLNDIPADFYNAHKDEYQQSDVIGTAGVEEQYEPYLHGKNGTLKMEVNINYQPINKEKAIAVEPVKGHDLKLTINTHLQQATEKALATQVQELHKQIKTIQNGAAVALNPKTGEVLALASYPAYDPNLWVKGISDQDYTEKFSPAEMNRALTQVYEPGSTLKMSTILIGLKEGAITPSTTFSDPGYTKFLDTTIRSWKSIGTIDPKRALAESSNVYMIETFKKVFHFNTLTNDTADYFLHHTMPDTMNKVLDYHKTLGLGLQTTGVDLPAEAKGKITLEGNAADLAFASFGQIEKYNLMQLAQYTATIANNGTRMKPYVVSEIKNPDGSIMQKTQPTVAGQSPFTPEQFKLVQEGMLDTTQKTYGTFYSVYHDYKYPVAAKTGTAETGRGTENSLFVGYAPYNDPQIAIAIIIPDNQTESHSSATLGPIAKAMTDAYFNLDQKTDDKKTN
jgi:penicillin-binding protein 2